MNIDNALIGVEEMASMLNVPTSWIYHRTSLNAIPFYKFGKYLRFDPNEVFLAFKNNEI